MIISCLMHGHEFRHEMQVITQIFFAHAKYVFCRELPAEGYAAVGSLLDKPGTCCVAELYLNGQCLASFSLDIVEPGVKAAKRTSILALFYAIKQATGQEPPWGALSGVRPSKQVRLWLEEGDTESLIQERLSKIYHCREDKIQLAIEVARAEARLISRQKTGLCLYVGIPFCPSRCLYCSFVTFQKPGPDVHRRYLKALAKEYQIIAAGNHTINAVYIGGGTPTALSEADLAVLLEMLGDFSGIEFTVEAGRPDSITKEKLTLLKEHGVNRIAINPQSLNDETLQRIGRAHTAMDFYKSYEMAQQLGFDNINSDVIVGLPGEGPKDVWRTMEGLKTLAPAHITVHTMAVKRASRLNEYRHDYPEGDLAAVDEMLTIAREACQELGLAPYYMYRQKNMIGNFENVGYSLPDYECFYNIAMMAETQTVLAIGAGAVTKTINGTLITRDFKPKDVETYIQRMGL